MCGQTQTGHAENFLTRATRDMTPHGRKAWPLPGGFGPPGLAYRTACWAYRRPTPPLQEASGHASGPACLLFAVVTRLTPAGGRVVVDEENLHTPRGLLMLPCVSENTWCSHQTHNEKKCRLTTAGAVFKYLPSKAYVVQTSNVLESQNLH